MLRIILPLYQPSPLILSLEDPVCPLSACKARPVTLVVGGGEAEKLGRAPYELT